MNALVVIPARGGSKGVPGKNIKLLNGKPLIHYTIDEARKIFDDGQIIISTDSEEIKVCAEKTGLKVPFLRPAELATDNAGTYEVLLHALDFYRQSATMPDVLVLLQPTSPFRKEKHIREAMERFSQDIDMVVSVKETKSNPYYVLFEENEEGFLKKSKESNYTRRQDCPKVWEYNGAIYVINVRTLIQKPFSQFEKIVKYAMGEKESHDIDDMMDWKIAEMLVMPDSY